MKPPAPEVRDHYAPLNPYLGSSVPWHELTPTASRGVAAPYRWDMVQQRMSTAMRGALGPLLVAVVLCTAIGFGHAWYVFASTPGSGTLRVTPSWFVLASHVAGLAAKWLLLGAVQILVTLMLGIRLGLTKAPRTMREHILESGTAVLFLMVVQIPIGMVVGIVLSPLLAVGGLGWVSSMFTSAIAFLLWIPVHAMILFEGCSATDAVREAARVTRHCFSRLIAPCLVVAFLIAVPGILPANGWGASMTGIERTFVLDPRLFALYGLQALGLTIASIVAVSMVAELRRSQLEYLTMLRRNAEPDPSQSTTAA